MTDGTGEIGPSGGDRREEGALREPPSTAGRQDERDEAELRRLFRELMLRQPDDVGLLLRGSRVLVRPKESRAEEERRQMQEALESLGDQLLPPGDG
jgi:hypothetical protein